MDDHRIDRLLNSVFKHTRFKSKLQESAVKAALERTSDVFVSMPTGAGKSLCYQLPAAFHAGVSFVVSPLLALIDDQVHKLKELGIATETLNSRLTAKDRLRIVKDLESAEPKTKLCYITPEQAATSSFQSLAGSLHKRKRLAYFIVDESHCISEWGHNFRPDYLRLGDVRARLMEDVPCIALTATATPRVQEDILANLRFRKESRVFKSGTYRSNLFYEVICKDFVTNALDDLASFCKEKLYAEGSATQGSGLVYCRTREDCEVVAKRLLGRGVHAKPYHAGLRPADRTDVQSKWLAGRVPIIVATVSFGMGIDKGDVRFVVHWTMAKSMENYYQESGRAGRDGKQSYCRLYYAREERNVIGFLMQQEAEKQMLKGKMKDHVKASQASFEKLVKYCECDSRCRHEMIATYFGETEKPKCDKGCDYCLNPEGVKTMCHQLESQSYSYRGRRDRGRTFGGKGGNDDDSFLYGGGRAGAAKEGGGQWSDAEGVDDSDEENKAELRELISEQFQLRRKKSKRKSLHYVNESPGPDCRLKNPTSEHIMGLSYKVREHCLGLIEKALGADQTSADGIDIEYDIFQMSRFSNTYRAAVAEIKASGSAGGAGGAAPSSFQSTTSTTEADVKQTPFIMASQLVAAKLSESSGLDESLQPKKTAMKRPAPAITYFFQKSAPDSKKSCPEKKDEVVASAGEGKTSLPADKKGSEQKTAKIVVDYLKPYYASKRITNRDLFKSLARRISHAALNSPRFDERQCKRAIDNFFVTHKTIDKPEQLKLFRF